MKFTPGEEEFDAGDEVESAPRRRKWPLAVFVLILLPVVALLLAPSVLSGAAARAVVLGQINARIAPAVLSVDDWSFAWFSGQQIRGIRYRDPEKQIDADVAEVSISRGLLRLLPFGKVDLGQILVRAPSIACTLPDRRATGGPAVPPGDKDAPADTAGFQLPVADLAGELRVVDGKVRVEGAMTEPFALDAAGCVVTVKSMMAPVELGFSCTVPGGAGAGSIAAEGVVRAPLDLMRGIREQMGRGTVTLRQIDLARFGALLTAVTGEPWVERGLLDGEATFDLGSIQNLGAKGQIKVDALSLRVPAQAESTPPAAVSAAFDVRREGAALVVRQFTCSSPWVNAALLGRLNQPVAAGAWRVERFQSKVGVNLVTLVRDFGTMLKLDPGVAVRGGTLSAQMEADGREGAIDVSVTVATEDLALTVGGEPLVLRPAPSFRLRATVPAEVLAPTGDDALLRTEIRELVLDSAFARVSCTGSLERASAKGVFDLTAFARDFRRLLPQPIQRHR